MPTKQFTTEELELLSSREGLFALVNSKRINYGKAIRTVNFESRLEQLQIEFLKLQKWVTTNQKKVVIVFEGRDAAGKGGAIRRMTEHLNPREYRVVALPKPDETERGQWYFQRYINQLPNAGEIVFFDRSWYNRAVVEPVNGFCTDVEYANFMSQVNEVERMMLQSGILLIKMYFSISKNEQERRFKRIIKSPLKKWKYSAVDAKALELWDDYTKFKEAMFEQTQEYVPWKIIRADKKYQARIASTEYVLSQIDYEGKDVEMIKPKKIHI